MKLYIIIFSMLLSSVFLFSCSDDKDNNEGVTVQRTIVDLIPKKNPINLTVNQRKLMNDCNDFSFNLFRESYDKKYSRIMSPLSVAFILSMLNNGAEGITSEEITNVLGFNGADKTSVNEFCANLIENVPKVDSNVQINIANALYVNKDISLLSEFEKDMKKYYQAAIRSLDFSNPSSAVEINKWCSKQTDGIIGEIIKETDSEKLAYLLNAIYFKATWTDQFDPEQTKTESFTKEDGSIVRLPMMNRYAMALVSYSDNYTSLCLPYSSGAFNMYMLLPDEGVTTSQLIENLTSESFNEMKARAEKHELEIKIPRFTVSLNQNLKDILARMGISRAFTHDAEFPNITTQNLFISEIRQSAMIEVNEQGTKTAAVTIAESATAAEPPSDFIAKRPFVYLIQETTSGAIFFIGTFMGD